MKKLKIPSNLTSLAYSSIKEYILEGKLDERSRLTEDFLSGRLGISKSPIREALNRLETEGLIRIEPRKGAYLRTLSPREMSQIYSLREALEVHAVRVAVITPQLLKDLRESIDLQRSLLRANDKAHYIEEDIRFHSRLALATANPYLCSALENVQNQIWLSRRNTYNLSGSIAPDFHQAILAALESDDRDKAQESMRAHIAAVREKLLTFLEQEPEAKSA